MSYENKTNAQGTLTLFELQLTKTQYNVLSKFLPQGYNLEVMSKNKKEVSSKPTKKIVTNEGNIVPVKKNGQVQAQPLAYTQAPAPIQASAYAQAQGGPTPNSTHSGTPPAKRTLRDQSKRKVSSYLEDRFGDIPAAPTTSSKSIKQPASEGLKRCFGLIQKLKKHNCSAPFLFPVDVEGLGLYDYLDIVDEPMDLSTVEKKLKAGEYSSVHECGADIRKIWNNAFAYNAEGSSIYQMTSRICAYFEKLFKEIDDAQSGDKVMYLEKKLKELSDKLTKMQYDPPVVMAPKMQRSGSKITKSPAILEDPMSVHEKKVLCDNIKRLPPDSLRGVWEIVSRGLPNNQNSKEELVFDIDALPVKITRELERYVKSKIGQSKQNKGKKETAPKPSVTVDLGGFEPHAQHYNHHLRPEVNGMPYQNIPQNQMPPMGGNQYMGVPRKDRGDDAESKSSDSSFISDSESGSDDEKKHKPKPGQNYLVKKQELANFQSGSHGSMLNSFVVK